MDQPRTSTGPTSLGWARLVPEQLWVAALAVAMAPGAYGIHLVRSGRVALGLGVLLGWGVLCGLLLYQVHRRRWARLWFTIPVTVVVVALGAWFLG